MLCLLRPSPRSSGYPPRHGGTRCYVQSCPLLPPSTAKLVSFSTSEIGTRCSVSVSLVARLKSNALQKPTYFAEEEEEDDDNGEDFQVLTAVRSNYNDIVIVETPKSRMLLLDSTRTVLTLFPPKNSLRFARWMHLGSAYLNWSVSKSESYRINTWTSSDKLLEDYDSSSYLAFC